MLSNHDVRGCKACDWNSFVYAVLSTIFRVLVQRETRQRRVVTPLKFAHSFHRVNDSALYTLIFLIRGLPPKGRISTQEQNMKNFDTHSRG
jgi:hypothetical protein